MYSLSVTLNSFLF